MMLSVVRKLKAAILLSLVAAMVGCASIPAGAERSPQDPWEPFNRSVFEFNEGLDSYLLKPVVAGYRFVLPEFVRDGIYNFFSNYSDIYTALQNMLQGKPDFAFNDLMRVVVNTTFGLGGLIGAGASDLARSIFTNPAFAYSSVFFIEALLFVVSAYMASLVERKNSTTSQTR